MFYTYPLDSLRQFWYKCSNLRKVVSKSPTPPLSGVFYCTEPMELEARLASMAEHIASLQKIVASQDEAIIELSEMLGDMLQIMAERGDIEFEESSLQ